MKNEHEQEMEKIRQNQSNKRSESVHNNAVMPELPVFDDTKDNIDDYLVRFERFAKIQKWETINTLCNYTQCTTYWQSFNYLCSIIK